jgi:IstB-like ATP binding protein
MPTKRELTMRQIRQIVRLDRDDANSWRSSRAAMKPLGHRHQRLPVDRWYEIIGKPTAADAILDRLVHNSYRIELKGDSLRKKRPPGPPEATTT